MCESGFIARNRCPQEVAIITPPSVPPSPSSSRLPLGRTLSLPLRSLHLHQMRIVCSAFDGRLSLRKGDNSDGHARVTDVHKKTTRRGFSASARSDFVMPYPKASAVWPGINRRVFKPAMAAALNRARLCMSVYQPGMAMTTSDTPVLSSFAAMSRSRPRYMPTNWVAEKVAGSPR